MAEAERVRVRVKAPAIIYYKAAHGWHFAARGQNGKLMFWTRNSTPKEPLKVSQETKRWLTQNVS